eukprot:gene6781-9289_t
MGSKTRYTGNVNVTNRYYKVIRLSLLLCCVVVLCTILYALVVTYHVNPEVGMVIHSSCKNPILTWDGDVNEFIGVKLRKKPRLPIYHVDLPSFETCELTPLSGNSTKQNKQPIIYWGAHHKTGTYIARKIFSTICSNMNWCCIFHPSKDLLSDMQRDFTVEHNNINIIGHNQWVWDPSVISGPNYIFFHFYRDPYKKVISGYNYHLEGSERWTRDFEEFKHICSATNHLLEKSDNKNWSIPSPLKATLIHSYCTSIHLCSTCCLAEHNICDQDLSKYPSDLHHHHIQNISFSLKQLPLAPRTINEYSFICEHLGNMGDKSLQEALQDSTPEEGLMIEASLDFYENLRMAKIISQTRSDHRTININLDDLSDELKYSSTISQILDHLKNHIPSKSKRDELFKLLQFFNYKVSPMYRLGMSNFLNNHIHTDKSSKSTPLQPIISTNSTLNSTGSTSSSLNPLKQLLKKNKAIENLYKEVYHLYRGDVGSSSIL